MAFSETLSMNDLWTPPKNHIYILYACMYTWNSVNLLDSWGFQFFIRPKVLCQRGHFSFQVYKSSFPTREKYQIAIVTWPGSFTSLIYKHLCVSIHVPLFFGTLSSWKLSIKFISQRATIKFKSNWKISKWKFPVLHKGIHTSKFLLKDLNRFLL